MQRMTRNKQNAAKTIEPADATAKIGTVADVASGLTVEWQTNLATFEHFAVVGAEAGFGGFHLLAGYTRWMLCGYSNAVIGKLIADGQASNGYEGTKRAAVIALASHIREQRLPKRDEAGAARLEGGHDCGTTAGCSAQHGHRGDCSVPVAKPAPRAFKAGDVVRFKADQQRWEVEAVDVEARIVLLLEIGGTTRIHCFASEIEHVADERPVIAFEWKAGDVGSHWSVRCGMPDGKILRAWQDGGWAIRVGSDDIEGEIAGEDKGNGTMDTAKRAAEAAYLALSK